MSTICSFENYKSLESKEAHQEVYSEFADFVDDLIAAVNAHSTFPVFYLIDNGDDTFVDYCRKVGERFGYDFSSAVFSIIFEGQNFRALRLEFHVFFMFLIKFIRERRINSVFLEESNAGHFRLVYKGFDVEALDVIENFAIIHVPKI